MLGKEKVMLRKKLTDAEFNVISKITAASHMDLVFDIESKIQNM